jgi:hypothetical protein
VRYKEIKLFSALSFIAATRNAVVVAITQGFA